MTTLAKLQCDNCGHEQGAERETDRWGRLSVNGSEVIRDLCPSCVARALGPKGG